MNLWNERAGRRLSRAAPLLALFAGVSLRSTPAEACSFPERRLTRIVGFDEAGRFVEYHRDENEGSEGPPIQSFTLYSATGKVLSRLDIAPGGSGPGWEKSGSSYFGHLADGLGDEDAGRLEKAIIKAKKLEKPSRGRKLRHVKSDAECGSIELKQGADWLRVAEGDEWRDRFGGCETFKLSGFEHEKADFVFVRVRQHIGSGEALEEVDETIRIPKGRIDGIALALRGERLRLKGQSAEAIAALEASIDAAPEYLPSRVSLVRAYATSGRKAPPLAALRHPIPEGRTLLGALPDDDLLAKLVSKWPGAKLPETLPWAGPLTLSRSVAPD